MNQKSRRFLIPLILSIAFLIFHLQDKDSIEGFSFELPENFTLEDTGNQTISFYDNGTLIGGLIQFRSPDERCLLDATQYADEIRAILEAKGVTIANNPEFDFIMTASTAAPDPNAAEMWFGNTEAEYMHYLFFTKNVGYDLWFDLNAVSSEIQREVLESCVVENSQ